MYYRPTVSTSEHQINSLETKSGFLSEAPMAGVTFFTEDGLDLSHVVDGRSIRDQFSWRIRMGSGDHKPTECGGERVRQKIDAVHFGDSLEVEDLIIITSG